MENENKNKDISLETKKAGAAYIDTVKAPAGVLKKEPVYYSSNFEGVKKAFFAKLLENTIENTEIENKDCLRRFAEKYISDLEYLDSPKFKRFLRNLNILSDYDVINVEVLETVYKIFGYIAKSGSLRLEAGPFMIDYKALREAHRTASKER